MWAALTASFLTILKVAERGKKPTVRRQKTSSFQVRYLVVHTAADARENGTYDTTAADIERWHRARGWSGIGYHKVVRRNGRIEDGRAETVIGAHTLGLNGQSLGICLSGHGDLQPMTQAQEQALIGLLVQLAQKYQVPPERIIGHREVNRLVEQGQLGATYRTSKTCPGTKISMVHIRSLVRKRLREIESSGG